MTDLSLRRIRYSIQLGLVDRHEGDRNHVHYTQRQLDQILPVRAISDQGVPLERIKHQIHGTTPPLPPPQTARDIAVIRKVYVAPGVELHLEPQAALGSSQKNSANLSVPCSPTGK